MKTNTFLREISIIIIMVLSIRTHAQSLQDNITLDFSETQYTFCDPMESNYATFLFKITNTSYHDIGIFRDSFTFNDVEIHQIAAPQGPTLLHTGESMWMRTNFSTRQLGYDYKTKQDYPVTLKVQIHDWVNQYEGDAGRYSFEKEIIIRVSGGENGPLCEVPFKVTVRDELGNPTDAFLDIVGPSPAYEGEWFNNNSINIDNSGSIEISLPMSSRYFVYVRKDGYTMFSHEYSFNEIPAVIDVQLQRKTENPIPQFTLTKEIKGDIGFWRGAVNETGDRILLVQGMENYYDNSLYEECKLFYLDVDAEEILWQYPIGWQSWVADIDDAGKYAAVATLYSNFVPATPPEGFVNYVAVLNQSTGQEIWKKNTTEENFPGIESSIGYSMDLGLSHNGNYLFLSVEVGNDFLLNADDGSIIWSSDVGNVREVLFSDDDQYLYISTYGGFVYKMRVNDGEIIWRQWGWCWAYISGFAISDDGTYLATGAKGGGISVINCETGALQFMIPDVNQSVSYFKWINNANDLLISGSGGLSRVCDINGNLKYNCSPIGGGFDWQVLDGNYLINDTGEMFDIRDGENKGQIFRRGKEPRISHFGWYSPTKKKYVWAVTETYSRNENIIEFYDVDFNTGIEPIQNEEVPVAYELYQNYPNPFNPSTTIKYQLPQYSHVQIKIYNGLGQQVDEIVNSLQNAGNYSLNWNANKYSSGIYFAQINAAGVNRNFSKTIMMLLIK